MSEDPVIDPAPGLHAENAALRARLVQSELRTEALRAGMVDLDGVRLIDPAAVQLTEAGTLDGGRGGADGAAAAGQALAVRARRQQQQRGGRAASGAGCAPVGDGHGGGGVAVGAGRVAAAGCMIGVAGLRELIARLRDADAAGTMASALEVQAGLMAEAVREGLSTPPGGDHARPWVQSGALQASIGHGAAGLQAVVGSSDPAAAPQEMGTVHLAPRPFLGPVAAVRGGGVAEAVGAAVARRLKGDPLS